ncbi:MAG: DUF481 domain-containing protein [Gammaproteobacteria bacterium]|nr:DUF481 domain-containing protein [Gammaproteobacteria bacterium]
MIIRTLTLLVLGLMTQSAMAIVNMADIHLNTIDQGIGGKVALSLSSLSGNSNNQDYEAGATLKWRGGKESRYLMLDTAYGESNDVAYTDKGFVHLREIYQMSPLLAWEAFAQVEQNRFARLSLRQLYGGGARFSFRQAEKLSFHLGTGLFQIDESLFDTGTSTDGGNTSLLRANLYLVLKYKVTDKIELVSSTYLQPALSDSGDWRLYEDAALQVPLSKALSLKLSLNYRHDNRPPQEVAPIDRSFKTSLEYRY